MSTPPSQGARIEDLTDTQRRVLDLIAEGKTNYEIGRALGITLDGAKYHVTEILNKLGVDSREEAAALAGARPSRLRGLRRLTTRRVLATAAGVGAVAVVAGVIIALLSSDDADGLPAVQVAFIQGEPLTDRQQIILVDEDGNRVLVGEERPYGTVYWSPSGRHLVAIERGPAIRVSIIDSRSGRATAVQSPRGLKGFEWSPDGDYLLLIGESAAVIHDTSGHEVATFSGEFHQATVEVLESGSWSPDSRRVALMTDDAVALLALDGSQKGYPLPPVMETEGRFFLEWLDDSLLRLTFLSSSPDADRWLMDTREAQPRWEPGPVEPFEGEFPARERAQAVAGLDTVLSCFGKTADRGGLAWTFMSEDRRYLVAVVVERDGELTRIEVPDNVSSISARPCVSAVLGP